MLRGFDTSAHGARLRLVLASVLACISVAVLAPLGTRASADEVFSWDARLHGFLSSYSQPEFNEVADDLINVFLRFGTNLFTLAILGAALYLLAARKRLRTAAFATSSVVGAIVLTYLFKNLFERPELSAYAKYELPSGHATRSLLASGLLLALAWGTRWRWRAAAAGGVFDAATGASVVYADWHLPSDVLAGWALATAVLATAGIVLLLSRGPAETIAAPGAKQEDHAAAPLRSDDIVGIGRT
jgi:membrane-associated phospholipid phosphatase